MKYNLKDVRAAVVALTQITTVDSLTVEHFDAILGDDDDNSVFEPWDNIATDIYLANGGQMLISYPMQPLDDDKFQDAQNEATEIVTKAYNSLYKSTVKESR